MSDSLYRQPILSLNHANISLPILYKHNFIEEYCYLINTKSYLFQVTEQYDSMEFNNKYAFNESSKLLGQEHLEHIKSINNLARIYLFKGKYIEAKELYINALKRAKNSEQKDNNLIGTLHENLGEIYRNLEDNELALLQYEKALEFHMQYIRGKPQYKTQFNPKYVVIKTAIANIYKDLNQDNISLTLYKDLQDYIQGYTKLTNKTYASFYYNYADLLKELMNYQRSKYYFSLALKYSQHYPLEKSKSYEKLAEIFILNSNQKEGVINIKRAIDACPKNMELRRIQLEIKLLASLPNSNVIKDSIKTIIKENLEITEYEKAVVNHNLRNTSTFHLREIINYYKTILSSENLEFQERINAYNFISHAMMGIVTFQYFQDSQFQLLKDIREIVNNALEELLVYHDRNSVYWEEALYFIELGKSILFYIDSQTQGETYKNRYQTRITELNYLNKNPSLSDKKKEEYLTEIASLTDSLLLNESTVMLNLPFKSETLLEYIQNRNIISYFTTDDDVFICSKIDTITEFRKIKINEIDQNICFDLTEECKIVSLKLLPFKLIPANSSLTISPDGWINSLPFDLLYHNDTQLTYRTDINYSYSLLGDLKKSMDEEYLASKNYLFQLPLSEYSRIHQNNELDNLSQYFNKHFTTSNCTKENFSNALSDGNIVHLSSHSESNSDSTIAYLQFAKDKLSLFDIYNLNIKSKLLVLSSCNNEVGEFNPGEGSNSLGRAFYHAGAHYIVSSLWELNEKSTSEIFKQFYLNLNEGYSSSKALQLAKKHYLNNAQSDREKNPYYWAGIISIGDMASQGSIQITSSNSKYYVIPVLLLLVFALFRKFRYQFF